jgi:hypothetical protein
MKLHSVFFTIVFLFVVSSKSQTEPKDSLEIIRNYLDSIYIAETESVKGKDKVLHAEPLFIDLIRDLGARKGEKEWNVGFGMNDGKFYDKYTALVEYEFAPADRLGMEFELPFSFYFRNDTLKSASEVPLNRLNSIKWAMQYSFFVSEKLRTSLALGYIHEHELTGFINYGKKNIYEGDVFNPFFIAAKRWGMNYHTLLYAGPVLSKHSDSKLISALWQFNSNFHYMISGTRNFIGIEINKEFFKNSWNVIFRPQMRLCINEHLMIGIISGIPVNRVNQRYGTFIRMIYEPRESSPLAMKFFTKKKSKKIFYG